MLHHRRMWRTSWSVALLLAAGSAQAQVSGAPEAETGAAELPRRWAAAVGAVSSVGPEYSGGARVSVNVQPGFAVRWGRVSLASRGAFAVRSDGASAQGGLRVDLVRSERWRSGLGLRWDSGRDESASEDLRGLGDVRGTLRLRASLGYRFDDGWRAGAALTTDALGRGGGWQGEFSAGRDGRLTPSTTWSAGVSLGYGGRRWQQSYYGITPEQSARSGYPVYTPGAGLRDVGVSVGGRTELDERWALFYGASSSRLMGPSADSPLVRERSGWGLSLGVVMRI